MPEGLVSRHIRDDLVIDQTLTNTNSLLRA
jgi:hypothetical protein